MAEVVVSVLIETLVSATAEFLKQKVKLVRGFREDASSLQSKLEAINAVLEDAEKKQLEDPAVRRWLDLLKDVAYDIDDVLDIWNTEILKSKIQNQNALVSKEKVCFLLPSSCFCLCQPKKVGIPHEVAHKIKKLNGTLERIAEERRNYSLETTKVVPNRRRRITTSFVDVSEVYGRDVDKNHLISMLLADSSSHGGQCPVVIPIVGMGGIGKTTLAKLAFNDDKVKENFNERIWVCVSQQFDKIGIAKAILGELKVGFQYLHTLQDLLLLIRESIEGKKFLLVLDDVWTGDREQWEPFMQVFRSSAARSRLLITARDPQVAIMMGVPTKMIVQLELLSEEHSWSLFSGLAFLDRDGDERQQLEEIGRKIANKCKGLPLEAKTLGALMRFKETKRDWEDVLSNQIWESQDEEIIHFAPFLLSYYDLPPLEQRCFSYCSVFPKDYEFERDDLIQMWMSQGYFNGDKDPENKGRNCFDNLTTQSFFHDFWKDDDGSIVACKMPDMLHYLAQFLTRNECITIKIDENTQPPTVKKFYHMTLIYTTDRVEFPTSMFNEGNLHSLFIVNSIWSANALSSRDQISRRIRYLRMLNMRCCRISRLPGELIGQLRHLRYFNLSENWFRELPDEVCDLCNLQTLRLTGCFNLERLPEGMGKLVNLRHLHICNCNKLQGLPKGIGRLTQLRTLDRVVIPENNHEEYLSIGDLEKMKNLQFERALEIMGCGNLKRSTEYEKVAELLGRDNHVNLHLGFLTNYQIGEKDGKEDDQLKILEALKPLPGLKSLVITGYGGANLSPKWMTLLNNLTRLKFCSCKFFETFPPLGRLPCLEELDIIDNRELRKIGGEEMGISSSDDTNVAEGEVHQFISFPKLKRLHLENMSRWEEWEGCESTSNMPRLSSLSIFGCHRLKSLPEFLKETPLRYLHICYCEILSESFREKEWAHISHVPNIKISYQVVKTDGN